MRVLGFPNETVEALLRLVAGLLHLGQVRFMLWKGVDLFAFA
jgi:myosin heavy subunit